MSRLPQIANPHRQAYPSDLSDKESEIIRPLLPPTKGFGQPRTVDLREVLNAIFYVHRSGCQWEMLPHDFPHHGTVYKYFQKWEKKGTWKQIHDQLRHKLRTQNRRTEKSTVATADSHSVETTEKSGCFLCRHLRAATRLFSAGVMSGTGRSGTRTKQGEVYGYDGGK